MIRTLLAATTALTLISGVAFAQSSYSSSTTETTRMMPTPPSHDVDVTTTTKRTDTPNGVLVEKDERGSETIRPGGVAASLRSSVLPAKQEWTLSGPYVATSSSRATLNTQVDALPCRPNVIIR